MFFQGLNRHITVIKQGGLNVLTEIQHEYGRDVF